MAGKGSRRALSLAYWGRVVLEWRASGKFQEYEIKHMIREAVEYSEVHGVADVGIIFEIANGERVA